MVKAIVNFEPKKRDFVICTIILVVSVYLAGSAVLDLMKLAVLGVR